MVFLIEYNRPESRMVTYRRFDDAQLGEAEAQRREIELQHYRNGGDLEVVLLRAEDEATVRRTHRRYFESLVEMLDSNGMTHSSGPSPDA